MLYTIAFKDGGEGKENDLEIEKGGFAPEVFFLKCDFGFERKFITAVDLRPAGETGFELVHSGSNAELHKVVLVVECRAWPYKNHIAFDDVDEVGEFIQTEFADERTCFEQVFFGITEEVSGNVGGVFFHAAEFVQLEKAVVFSDTFLFEKYRKAIFKPYYETK